MSPTNPRVTMSLTANSTILLHPDKITAELYILYIHYINDIYYVLYIISVFIWTLSTFKLTSTIPKISKINYVLNFELLELL